jgi:hypothetical protein
MARHKEPKYLAYLLRLWQEDHGGRFIWRASVEMPGLDKRLAFADLTALFAFLEAQTEADASANPSVTTPE